MVLTKLLTHVPFSCSGECVKASRRCHRIRGTVGGTGHRFSSVERDSDMYPIASRYELVAGFAGVAMAVAAVRSPCSVRSSRGTLGSFAPRLARAIYKYPGIYYRYNMYGIAH